MWHQINDNLILTSGFTCIKKLRLGQNRKTKSTRG